MLRQQGAEVALPPGEVWERLRALPGPAKVRTPLWPISSAQGLVSGRPAPAAAAALAGCAAAPPSASHRPECAFRQPQTLGSLPPHAHGPGPTPLPALHAPDAPPMPAVGLQELIAGGVAGGAAKTCVAPLERCKILFQASALFTFAPCKHPDLVRQQARHARPSSRPLPHFLAARTPAAAGPRQPAACAPAAWHVPCAMRPPHAEPACRCSPKCTACAALPTDRQAAGRGAGPHAARHLPSRGPARLVPRQRRLGAAHRALCGGALLVLRALPPPAGVGAAAGRAGAGGGPRALLRTGGRIVGVAAGGTATPARGCQVLHALPRC